MLDMLCQSIRKGRKEMNKLQQLKEIAAGQQMIRTSRLIRLLDEIEKEHIDKLNSQEKRVKKLQKSNEELNKRLNWRGRKNW